MIKWLKAQWYKYEESLLYLVFGGLTTLVDFMIYLGMTKGLGFNYLFSNVVAFSGAVVFAFFTNKIYVFKSHSFKIGKLLYEMVTFIGARLFSLVLNMAIMIAGVEWLELNDLIVKVMAGIVVVMVNYGISKWLIFAKTSPGSKVEE